MVSEQEGSTPFSPVDPVGLPGLAALGTWMRARHEEIALRATFGATYDAYAARVKRFVPGIL